MDLSATGPVEGALFATVCRVYLHGHTPRPARMFAVEIAVITVAVAPALGGLASASISRDRVQAFLAASLVTLVPALLYTASLPAPPFTLLRWVCLAVAGVLLVVGIPALVWNARVLAKRRTPAG